MFKIIKEWLRLPEVKNISSLDAPETTELHAQIIKSKPFLQNIYAGHYDILKKAIPQYPQGKFVELGSGGGFIKEINPEVITSDVLALKNVDLCFSGESMPFEDQSVHIFFMIDVMHHIKNPRRVLSEMNRCLTKGGRIIMIEPANTLWGRFIFQNFHHEPFDPKAGWKIEGDGPMSDANGALPWIIFSRDRKQFETEYPSLKIITFKCHTPFRYLISGGVSMKQLLPTVTYPLIKAIEFILTPLNPWMGMFCRIELEKEG